jgi:hypothetical protein
MATERKLPERFNPLMIEEVPPCKSRQTAKLARSLIGTDEALVARRRLGQTDLAVKAGQVGTSNSTKPKNLGTFDYAHLRAPLPKGIISGIFKPSPASYFLMRRSHDGYISATGMFKATFPYAEISDEETERKYIKTLESTSTDETAGNVWIPPHHALELAEEYKILPWIKALLDNSPIEVNMTKDQSPKSIQSPPAFLLPQEALAAPTPSRGRPRRSASPSKIASPRKTAGSTRARKTKAGSEEPSARGTSKSLQKALKTGAEDNEALTETSDIKEEPIKEEPVVKVNVDTDVVVENGVETTHTHVEVEMPAGSKELPLPEDTAAMIAKAKEMVEAATKADGIISAKPKRKADEIEEDETEEGAVVAAPAKKVKVETELKKERVKTRALIGLSATLAIGYVLPLGYVRQC